MYLISYLFPSDQNSVFIFSGLCGKMIRDSHFMRYSLSRFIIIFLLHGPIKIKYRKLLGPTYIVPIVTQTEKQRVLCVYRVLQNKDLKHKKETVADGDMNKGFFSKN